MELLFAFSSSVWKNAGYNNCLCLSSQSFDGNFVMKQSCVDCQIHLNRAKIIDSFIQK